VPPIISKTSTLLIVVPIVKIWFVAPTPKYRALMLIVILKRLVKFRGNIIADIPNLVNDVVNPVVLDVVIEVVEIILFQLVPSYVIVLKTLTAPAKVAKVFTINA
jgi:hypothetical protein